MFSISSFLFFVYTLCGPLLPPSPFNLSSLFRGARPYLRFSFDNGHSSEHEFTEMYERNFPLDPASSCLAFPKLPLPRRATSIRPLSPLLLFCPPLSAVKQMNPLPQLPTFLEMVAGVPAPQRKIKPKPTVSPTAEGSGSSISAGPSEPAPRKRTGKACTRCRRYRQKCLHEVGAEGPVAPCEGCVNARQAADWYVSLVPNHGGAAFEITNQAHLPCVLS